MTMNETLPESLTDKQWEIAHAIARSLVQEETDVNELGKAIAYLRNAINQNQSDAGSKFFKYLKTLVSNGRQIGHSGRTSDYYRSIEQICSHYLQNQPINADTLLQILGWSARLMRYYKEGGAIGEINTASTTSITQTPISSLESPRQAEVKEVMQSQKFQIGQVIEAEVTNIKGKEVTYEIFGKIRLTVKEPKKYQSMSVKQIIKVEIMELKEDGGIKKVKSVE